MLRVKEQMVWQQGTRLPVVCDPKMRRSVWNLTHTDLSEALLSLSPWVRGASLLGVGRRWGVCLGVLLLPVCGRCAHPSFHCCSPAVPE